MGDRYKRELDAVRKAILNRVMNGTPLPDDFPVDRITWHHDEYGIAFVLHPREEGADDE